MRIPFTRTAVLVMAFGFLYGCTPTANLEQARQYKADQQLEQALELSINHTEQYPEDGSAHFLTGQIYYELARDQSPDSRVPFYTGMISSFERAENARNPIPQTDIQSAVNMADLAFDFEFGRANDLLAEYEHGENGGFANQAMFHFENAHAIRPNHPETIDFLFELYTQQEETHKAGLMLAQLAESSRLTRNQAEMLGYFKFNEGQFAEAVTYLTQAWDSGRGTANAGRGLANAFAKTGDRNGQFNVLEQLVVMEPDNIYNHLSLGRNLGVQTQEALEELAEIQGQTGIDEQTGFTFSLIDQAEQAFQNALQLDSSHMMAAYSAGAFYYNTAIELDYINQQRPLLFEDEEFSEMTDRFKREALSLLEQSVELDSENKEAWAALAVLYTDLGLDERARQARSNAAE